MLDLTCMYQAVVLYIMSISSRQRELLTRTWVDFMPMKSFADNPFIVDRADGIYYWDVTNKRYIDAIGGIFVASLGHRHPRVMDAVRTQMDRVTIAPPMHGIADISLELVDRLGAITPDNLDFVKTFSGGSEATEAAIKLSRQYWKQSGHPGKYKVISRYYGYHGGTFGAMAASGTGSRKSKFEPQMSGFVKVFPPNHFRDQFDDWERCNRFAASMVEDTIIAEDPETVAAVMVEPIGNTGGIITPTSEYLALLREICDRHSVILIFDEVITGFGKTGNMFAAQTFEVTPDVICCGKGMSSGIIPIGAISARREIGEAFWGSEKDDLHFMHGHTYAGNPLAAAAAIAVIDTILEDDLLARASENGAHIRSRLEELKRTGVVREVRGKGVLLGVELTDPRVGKMISRRAVNDGIILRVDPLWFAVAPALIATDEEIEEICDQIDATLSSAIVEANI